VSISHNSVLIIYSLPKKTYFVSAIFVITIKRRKQSIICVEIRTEMEEYLHHIRDQQENSLNFFRNLSAVFPVENF
jgi:predicted neutral ceramidase superfamily lipid hydrolase